MLSPGLTPSPGISDMAPRDVGAASPQGWLCQALGNGEARSPGSAWNSWSVRCPAAGPRGVSCMSLASRFILPSTRPFLCGTLGLREVKCLWRATQLVGGRGRAGLRADGQVRGRLFATACFSYLGFSRTQERGSVCFNVALMLFGIHFLYFTTVPFAVK